MSLENLLAIHRLQPFDATPGSGRLAQAEALLAHPRHWLQDHRPDLLAKDQ